MTLLGVSVSDEEHVCWKSLDGMNEESGVSFLCHNLDSTMLAWVN